MTMDSAFKQYPPLRFVYQSNIRGMSIHAVYTALTGALPDPYNLKFTHITRKAIEKIKNPRIVWE
jgi:hypothetical protein